MTRSGQAGSLERQHFDVDDTEKRKKNVMQKCRKIRGLGCVNQACTRARVMQPSPHIFLHICRSWFMVENQANRAKHMLSWKKQKHLYDILRMLTGLKMAPLLLRCSSPCLPSFLCFLCEWRVCSYSIRPTSQGNFSKKPQQNVAI